jgi:hypothetical protein
METIDHETLVKSLKTLETDYRIKAREAEKHMRRAKREKDYGLESEEETASMIYANTAGIIRELLDGGTFKR